MKVLFVLVLSCCLASVPVAGFTQKKLALIVSIGDYADAISWKHIASLNDLKYITKGLKKFGFSDENTATLKNQNATKKGILAALDTLASKADSGDIVVFYFCGHGQQIMDNDSDELDGYDEALIPYDAKGAYDPRSYEMGGYQGQNHLRDDELGLKLKKIRDGIGINGSLLVMLDACHSGSGTRSKAETFSVCRGLPYPFKSPEYTPGNKISLAGSKSKRDNGFLEADEKELANMVVISASGPNQLNHQTRDQDTLPVGSLSYAFAKTLDELNPGDNYQLLFEKVKARIQAWFPTQVPVLEGDGSQEIFGGRFKKQEEIISIAFPRWINDTAFYFDKGYLDDAGRASTFTLSLLGKTEIIASGYIAKAEAFQSIGVVNKKIDRQQGYQLKLNALNYGDFSASLYINTNGKGGSRALALENQVKNYVKSYSFLSVNKDADFMIDIATGAKDTIRLIEKTDSTRWSRSLNNDELLTESDLNKLLNNIKAAMRIQYLRNIKDGGTLAKGVTAEIVPVKKNADTGPHEPGLKNGDYFTIKITNNSELHLYYSIIYIFPDNYIKILLPRNKMPATECQLVPKQTYTTDTLVVSDNIIGGKEIVKFILSESPLDLRSVISRLKTQRAAMQSFEKVFDDMFNDSNDRSKRKRDMSNIEIDKIGIITAGFTIVQ